MVSRISTNMDAVARYLSSKSEVLKLLAALEGLQKSAFKDTRHESHDSEALFDNYGPLLKELRIENSDLRDNAKLGELKDMLNDINYVHITLAFPPSVAFLKKMQKALAKSLDSMPLFDVNVDPTIIGGAILDYQGIYEDLSLKTKFNKYLIQHKDAIISKLQK